MLRCTEWSITDSNMIYIYITCMSPHLQAIICRSMLTASFPDSMKNAIITPQIKNINFDPNDLNNY